MQHPSIHAEIARQAHVEALRAARHTHELNEDRDVSELYTLGERVVARLASRLTPELSVTLPLPVVVARRGARAGA